MCGIAGIITPEIQKINLSRLKGMTDIIAHRGPDGEGHWINEEGTVGLGHRRLAIVDLNPSASQPMHYLNRYTIVYNGEIYNYLENKQELLQQGYRFNTESDTEILMALYDRDKENCLQYLDGMFSFVIYDKEKKTVFAACDRFGEKPFFYNYEPGKSFIFGSELKALWASGIPRNYDEGMLYHYLNNNVLLDPKDLSQTFFKDCKRLPPAHYMILDTRTYKITSLKKYWDIDPQIQDNRISPIEAEEKLKSLIKTSVSRRLRSDVPLGSSLSGGLDSSIIVWQINEILKGTGTQKTFSARFPGYERDEGEFMKLIIDQTNAEPYFTFPDGQGLEKDFDDLCYRQEEPFGSASIYAQYRVMKLAKENNVVVMLDGQGADEVMAGYHGFYHEYFKELKQTDPALFKKEYQTYKNLQSTNKFNQPFKNDFLFYLKNNVPGLLPVIKKSIHNSRSKLDPFLSDDFSKLGREIQIEQDQQYSDLNSILYASTMNGGLQQLLRYADRNSMAFGREVRLPYLNHDLVRFIFSLQPQFKIRDGWTKWILRNSYKDELPAKICWRKEKIGYEPPQKQWMQNKEITERVSEYKSRFLSEGILHKRFKNKELPPEKVWAVLMGGYTL